MELKKFVEGIRNILKSFNYIDDNVGEINIRRLYYLSLIFVPVHLTIIIVFMIGLKSSFGIQYTWRLSIIILHLIMFLATVPIVFLCNYIKKKQIYKSRQASFFYNICFFGCIIFGAGFCIIDNLMTLNITAYIVTCIAAGLIILIKPKWSIIYYGLSYIFFWFAAAIVQADSYKLLSLRMNGLLAASYGICVSIIIWRTNMANLWQSKRIVEQQMNLEETNKQLELLATRDALTGLYNRKKFWEIAEVELNRMQRSCMEACIVLVDIDHFKKINDSFGHPVGDAVLQEVSNILIRFTRSYDVQARLGGEEFIILLPETSVENGFKVAEKLREEIEKCCIKVCDKEVNITASFGVGSFSAEETYSFDSAYINVDKALYRAKDKGRNRIEAA